MEKLTTKIWETTTTANLFTGKLSIDLFLAHALYIRSLTDVFIRDSSH
jgi:hypothetical protein